MVKEKETLFSPQLITECSNENSSTYYFIFYVPVGKGGIIERFFKGDKYTLERGVTVKRWTFLISQTGKLLYKNNQVNAVKDSEQVMNFVKSKK